MFRVRKKSKWIKEPTDLVTHTYIHTRKGNPWCMANISTDNHEVDIRVLQKRPSIMTIDIIKEYKMNRKKQMRLSMACSHDKVLQSSSVLLKVRERSLVSRSYAMTTIKKRSLQSYTSYNQIIKCKTIWRVMTSYFQETQGWLDDAGVMMILQKKTHLLQ